MPPRNGLMSPVGERSPSGKDQHRQAVAGELADVLQRLPRAGLALRQREGVEEERRQVVVQRVGEPLAPACTRAGKKCALKNSLAIAGATRARQRARQRRQNHRHVHVALMVGREDHRPSSLRDARRPSTRTCANTRASGRIHVAWRQPPDERAPASGGSRTGNRPARRPASAASRLLDQLLAARRCSRLGEPRLVDARLKAILERDHQLDALERAQAELLERRRRRSSVAAARESSRSALRASPPVGAAAAPAAGLHPVANRARVSASACPRCAAARRSATPTHVRMR